MKKYIAPEVECAIIRNANIIATSFNIDKNGDLINDGGLLVAPTRYDEEDDDF